MYGRLLPRGYNFFFDWVVGTQFSLKAYFGRDSRRLSDVIDNRRFKGALDTDPFGLDWAERAKERVRWLGSDCGLLALVGERGGEAPTSVFSLRKAGRSKLGRATARGAFDSVMLGRRPASLRAGEPGLAEGLVGSFPLVR